MDTHLQKAIATSKSVDSLRILFMSMLEGASETTKLLCDQLVSEEMARLGVEPRDFFQTIIGILKVVFSFDLFSL
jgi:hypothetical protein